MYGIIGALVLRLIFILAGAALLDAFHWVIYIFGAFLVYTAYRLLNAHGETVEPDKNPILKLIRSRMKVTDDYHSTKVFIRKDGVRYATPVLAVLAVVATTDVIFAIDSIPAIFAVTREPFIVFAANAFALMGLRALYFLLAGAMQRFEYLSHGLALLLAIVGLKMLLSGVFHPPVWATLVVITVVLGGAVAYSLWVTRRPPRPPNGRAPPARGTPRGPAPRGPPPDGSPAPPSPAPAGPRGRRVPPSAAAGGPVTPVRRPRRW
jgi:tellurite resistance protein TerC